jgi:hypothetical protein
MSPPALRHTRLVTARDWRQHVGRQPLVDQVVLPEVLLADLQQVAEGVEAGHEEALELLDLVAGHGCLPIGAAGRTG